MSKIIFDNAVSTSNFKMSDVYDNLSINTSNLTTFFTASEIKKLLKNILRFSFLIELVNDEITSTKYDVRWSNKLLNDPRHASYDDCLNIFNKLLNDLNNLSSNKVDLIKHFLNSPAAKDYELPLDYINSSPTLSPLHHENNVSWIFSNEVFQLANLRSTLLDSTINPESHIFLDALKNKIKIKTYKTDRVQTGNFQTNREKRWEINPSSVHFALRRECFEIERTLLSQICHFKGISPQLIQSLTNKGFISGSDPIYCCPVTGEPLSYLDFKQEVLTPSHGKSKFQVGHMEPLKSSSSGHIASNIGWISDDGNRIQGHLSLTEIEDLLKTIFKNKGF